MENNELKAKYMFQYYGCKYTYKNEFGKFSDQIRSTGFNFNKHLPSAYLELRPIDSFTDAEIRHVALLRGYKFDFLNSAEGADLQGCYKEVRSYLKSYAPHEVRFCLVEYLKSIGVAVPCFDPSTNQLIPVDKLVEWGWVKISK